MEVPSTKIKIEIEIDQTLWAEFQELIQYLNETDTEGVKYTQDGQLESLMRQYMLQWAIHRAHRKYCV